jgi:hypothetical protein
MILKQDQYSFWKVPLTGVITESAIGAIIFAQNTYKRQSPPVRCTSFDIRHNHDGRAVSSTRRPHLTLHPLTPKKLLHTHFCQISGPDDYWIQTAELGHLKISTDPTGNRARNLPPCGAVPQPTEPNTTPMWNRLTFPPETHVPAAVHTWA